MPVYLQYAFTDEGVGAQVQRILTIIAVCKVHGFKYIHNTITVGHNYKGVAPEEWDDKWNAFFNLGSHPVSVMRTDIEKSNYHSAPIYVKDGELNALIELNKRSEDHIISVYHALAICDANPDKYYGAIAADVKNLLSRESEKTNDSPVIVIHIRALNQCDVCTGHVPGGDRFTDYDNYTKLIEKFNVMYNRPRIEIFTQDSTYIRDFAKTISDNVHLNIDSDVFHAFATMQSADVLVIAKSSFSYLAGLYNTTGQVYYFPFWHSPRASWIKVEVYM